MSDRTFGTRSVLVTGGSRGIGREIALQLARDGARVTLMARDRGALEVTAGECLRAGGQVSICPGDVGREADCSATVRHAIGEFGTLDMLIANAGISMLSTFEDLGSLEPLERVMRVNYLGSVHVAQALLPQLRDARGRAVRMFVASVAGLRGFPELAGYSASKFAVVGFAQALRDEVHESNVDVRVLCPPPGDTPMVRNLPRLPPIYKLSKMFSAEQVVDAAMRGIEKRSWIVLVDLNSRALERIGAWMPGMLDRVIRIATK